MATKTGEVPSNGGIWKGYIYLLPILIVLITLDFYPIAYAVYISFTNFGLFHFFSFSFVGLANYSLVFRTGLLTMLLIHTAIFSVGSILVMVPFGLGMAVIMNQRELRGKYIFRTLFLFPWAFPAFVTILIWRGMLDYNLGIINKILAYVSISPVNWLGTGNLAMLSLILVNLWLSFPYYTFVYTSALQSVPQELYDAAEMDGYGALSRLTKIVFPLLSRQIAFISIFGFITAWNNFYLPYLLTYGGPGLSTQTLPIYTYIDAFANVQFAIGSALSIISMIILAIAVIIINHYSKMMTILY